MNETNLMRSIMFAISKPGTRIFRNNTAMAWTGSQVIRNRDGSVTIKNARPLHAGLCKGSSDLIGWKATEITPEMVGSKVAIFTAVEVKGQKTKITPEQTNFIDRVKIDGGLAGIARTVEDALNITNQ